jgi:hypothetical protein
MGANQCGVRNVKRTLKDQVIYSISVADIQHVARELLERPLTRKELVLVQDMTPDYIDWFQAIENAINRSIVLGSAGKS